MYQARYNEIIEDDQFAARRVEHRALDRCVALLGFAEAAGAGSREAIEALHWTREVWQALLLDLADDRNQLPKKSRAALISVGIWILKEADAIRLEHSTNFSGIAEICAIIRDGLR